MEPGEFWAEFGKWIGTAVALVVIGGGPAEWNYTKHTIVVTGAPTALGTTIDPSHAAKAPKSKATVPAK